MQKSRQSITLENLTRVILHHNDFTFSQLLTHLREIYGISRKDVHKDTAISPHHLFAWETYSKLKRPNQKSVQTLAEYYDFPFDMLWDKAKIEYPKIDEE